MRRRRSGEARVRPAYSNSSDSSFGYNSANERPEIAFVRVRKMDGTVVATSPESVQDLSSPVQRVAPIYTDFRQKHITVQSLRPGDTLEFSVMTEIHTPLAPGQFWTEYDFQRDAIVLDEQLTLDVPTDTPLTLKTLPGLDPSIRKEGGRAIYRWNGSNLKRDDENAKSVKSSASKVAAVHLDDLSELGAGRPLVRRSFAAAEQAN